MSLNELIDSLIAIRDQNDGNGKINVLISTNTNPGEWNKKDIELVRVVNTVMIYPATKEQLFSPKYVEIW